MSRFKFFIFWMVVVEILLILLTNGLYFYQNNDSDGKLYLVEARRVLKEIEEQKLGASEIEAMSLNKYESIVGIREFVAGEVCANDYFVEEIAGKLYRIEYVEERNSRLPLYINISLLGMMIVTNIVLVYVYQKVLKPFWDMSNLSYELAKGNLSMPVKEEKSKLFGRFLWGMDMLREKLEDNKEKELEFQKERKALILSLSHDIKTPLSSIELYSKALLEDLYDTQERKDAALQGIARNVKEIKGHLKEIVTASREDLVYLYSFDMETALSQIKPLVNNSALTLDRAFVKFTYIFDMIVVGILLMVSIILIIIAFVVLRFTVSFTLSEEFREIGVMKAIGIGNFKIRGLYLVKYMGLSIIGATIGLALSFPFGKMLMSVSSQNMIVGNQSPILVNIVCAVLVAVVILWFCYGCTGRVKKLMPIDAIRSGQTGERFRKKSLMSLGKSRLPMAPFLALNDIASSPRRYSIITLTFFLCLSLLLILSATVSTMNSNSLAATFGWADCDIYLDCKIIEDCMLEDGHEKLEKHLDKMEQTLAENDIPAKCYQEMMFILPVSFRENESNICIYQGTGSTMDMYEYTAGTAPQNTDEIASTRIAADKLNAKIGDTVTVKTIDGDKEYIISAFFQSMNMQGSGIRLHSDAYINYVQAGACGNTQITFTDHPDSKEIERRIGEIQRIFPDYKNLCRSSSRYGRCRGCA